MKKLYVNKSSIQGNGIHAGETIKKNEHIAFIKGTIKSKTSSSKKDALSIPLWYGVTETLWIDPENTIWCYFNHSCEPNSAIVGTRKLIALKNIKKDTELTFDYSMTDGDTLWEMPCHCRSKKCRGIITSIQRLPEKVYRSHLPFIPTYFKRLRKKYTQSATM